MNEEFPHLKKKKNFQMTRKVKGNASCWLTRKTMKIPPQNHSLGNIPIVIVPDFLPVRCVPTKNSSPQPPNSSLACGQNSRARGIDGWVKRSRAVPNTHPPMMIFFFAKNWRCSWKQSWRDARRPRIRHAAFRASNPPGYYYYAYERSWPEQLRIRERRRRQPHATALKLPLC